MNQSIEDAKAKFTLDEIAEFLYGAAPLDGVWFGDPHPTEKGNFWWRKHLQAARQSSQSEPVAYKCFHCSESFTDEAKAAEHFGVSEMQEPACHIDITKYREMERYVAMAREEDTETDRAMHALKSQHQIELQREEEKGYARGLRDANYSAAPQQAIPSGWISVDDVKRLDRFPYGNNGNYEFRKSVLALVESASPTAPIESDK
jgi:hypothetical protein